jgi:hypothetical protein
VPGWHGPRGREAIPPGCQREGSRSDPPHPSSHPRLLCGMRGGIALTRGTLGARKQLPSAPPDGPHRPLRTSCRNRPPPWGRGPTLAGRVALAGSMAGWAPAPLVWWGGGTRVPAPTPSARLVRWEGRLHPLATPRRKPQKVVRSVLPSLAPSRTRPAPHPPLRMANGQVEPRSGWAVAAIASHSFRPQATRPSGRAEERTQPSNPTGGSTS